MYIVQVITSHNSVFYKNENEILALRKNYKDLQQQFLRVDQMNNQIADIQIWLKENTKANFSRTGIEDDKKDADDTIEGDQDIDDMDEFSDNDKSNS